MIMVMGLGRIIHQGFTLSITQAEELNILFAHEVRYVDNSHSV